MDRRRALAVLGTAATCGCLRLESEPTQTTGDAATRQPGSATATTKNAETSTRSTDRDVETTSESPTYPSGLSEDGAEFYLADFHESVLEATSFRAEWSKLNRDDGSFKWRKHYESEPGRAVGRATARAMGGPADVYRTADDGTLWRENLGDDYTYGRESSNWHVRHVVWREEITPLVRGVSWSSPERVSDGRPAVWETSAVSVRDASQSPGYLDGELLDVSARLRVDERGFISSLEATYRVQMSDARGGDVRRFQTSFTVDAVGETSVSEPAWASTAASRRPRISAPVTEDGRYVALTVESGNRIEANSIVTVYAEASDASYGLRLDAPIESGETVYLYRFTDSASFPQLRLSRGGRPDSDPPLAFDGTLDVWARRATLLYAKVNR